jgi:predicted NUDIX family NTP pyrophosphohydrolase
MVGGGGSGGGTVVAVFAVNASDVTCLSARSDIVTCDGPHTWCAALRE